MSPMSCFAIHQVVIIVTNNVVISMCIVQSNRGPQSGGRKQKKNAERKASSQVGKDSARKGPKHKQTGETSENTLQEVKRKSDLNEDTYCVNTNRSKTTEGRLFEFHA